jgi:hypothetical protein
MALAAGQVGQPVDDLGALLQVSLDRQAQAVPAGRGLVAGDRLEHVQGRLKPVGLLGVDAEPDVRLAGQHRQMAQPGHQLVQQPVPLGHLVAGMERRQLDRDPGALDRSLAVGVAADGDDGVRVSLEVALGVFRRARGLAQHVEGMPIPLTLLVAHPAERLGDRAPGDELMAEDAHGLGDRLADHRLAAPGHQVLEQRRGLGALVGVHLDDPAGQHQRPGGGVDEPGLAVAQVALPVGAADLVADQPVGGVGIGDAQQRLGQAHEQDTLAVGELVFVHEGVDAAAAHALLADLRHQAAGGVGDAAAGRGAQVGLGQQVLGHRRLVGPVGVLDGAAQRIGFGKPAHEGHGSPLIRDPKGTGKRPARRGIIGRPVLSVAAWWHSRRRRGAIGPAPLSSVWRPGMNSRAD